MTLRLKLILALLASSLLSVAVMWGVAYERLERRFDDIVETTSARNFRGDVAAYWLTYGSWDAGVQTEPFIQFVRRRKDFLAVRGDDADTGDDVDAQALPPRPRPINRSASPSGPAFDGNGGAYRPPFRFLLFDPAGVILDRRGPPTGEKRLATPEQRRKAVPIRVKGEIVAYASREGHANYSATDLAYRDAMENALAWGIGAAALMALGLGLLAGRHFGRTITPLLQALIKMGDGAVHQQVPVTARDEIGLLAQAFNRMSAELAQSHAALRDSHQQISAQAQQLYEASIRDGLTGLYNRRHFDSVVEGMIAAATLNAPPLALAIADIDDFKRINDGFSHATGDAVLRTLATFLTETARPGDVVARYGGEEFTLAFPNTDLAAATALCERLRQRVETHAWDTIAPTLRVTLSLGVAACAPGGGGLEDTLKQADRRLYQAKNAGRNRVCGAEGSARASEITLA